MKTTLNRLAFYTADLKLVTGKSDRTCQRTMQLMRDFYGLQRWQQTTIYHASEFLGIPIEQLGAFIKFYSG
jgi:hypothetical protein